MAILRSKQPRPGHAAGIYSDMTLDGPEIGTLVVVVDRAKNLPNRKTMGKQDPYCAMRLAKEAKKTETDRRGGQTPKWDQELRFTVHDSPDYYKLKCSIFAEDKRTDLVGEAWVDLTNVIKLGGGQSDVWQQLNCKGKYAGDIRIELTFYDTREKPQEKKRSKEPRLQAVESSSDLSLSTGRSLGPREIKRRPLPAGPPGSVDAHPSAVPLEPTVPQLPPKVPFDYPHPQHEQQPIYAPTPTRPGPSAHESGMDQPQESYHDDYAYENDYHHMQQQPEQHLIEQTQQPWQQPLGHEHRDYYAEQQYQSDMIPQESNHYVHDDMHLPTGTAYPDENEIWQQQRPQSVHMHSEPVTPQYSSPIHRPSPASANSDSQLVRFRQNTLDDTPLRQIQYNDSPLRQSMSHDTGFHDAQQEELPPPLPPKHRDTPPRRPRNEYPPSAFVPQPLRVGQKRVSFSERSPLQSLEDDYLNEQPLDLSEGAQAPAPQRHSMYVTLPAESPQVYDVHQPQSSRSRRNSQDIQQYSAPPAQSVQRPASSGRRLSYEIRHPSFNQQAPLQMQRAQTDDFQPQTYDSAHQPFVEDAPPSPGLLPAVSRKAVGASPKKLSGVPFGPDAYDVLNPASSPVTNDKTIFQTPDQSKEAQRMKEVEKVRDLGPIIGNDGREIDPSDHLPSDTWAPEPERKNRKPEHVIHIRSRSDRPAGARTSPLVVRHKGSSSTIQSSPAPAASPQSNASPASRMGPTSFIGGRNRLQKPMPANVRQPPTQLYSSPVGATASSPALAGSPQAGHPNEQSMQRPVQQRRPSADNRVPSHLVRPPLSEYQVPVGGAYTPRSGGYDTNNGNRRMKAIEYGSYESTPSKQPPQSYNYSSSPGHESTRRNSFDNRERRNSYDRRSDYSYENYAPTEPAAQPQQQNQQHYDDPLAAEMSLIDIGPSRHSYHQGSMGRSMARRW